MSTDAVAHEGHPPHLAHHFDNPTQQYESGKLGMWLFLGTEILMFGGLFCAYAIFRANYPEIFHYGHRFLDVKMGGINTVVLICSSLTMAWAVRAAQLGQRMALVVLLGLTLVCAGGFMGIKYVEYKAKFEHGLLPGTHYSNQGD
ncbi:cytochrome c oxidase subunit 3, partial [bacterium]|nr:cytochrome c oxidase subunit 3 [bacterium]